MSTLDRYHEALDASYQGLPLAMAEPMEKAVEASPDTATLHVLLAIAYERTRRFEDAKTQLEQALELEPGSATANYYMGRMMIQTGNPEACEAYYQLAAELDPDSYRAQLSMAQRLSQQQRLDEAVPYLKRLCALQPEQRQNWNQLLHALRTAGRWSEIAEFVQQAAERFPEDLYLSNFLAWTLATAPEEGARDPARALALAKDLAQRTNMEDPGILDTLAAAQAATGDYESAKKTLQKALLIAHEYKLDELLTDMRARLALYQQGTPYRDAN
jgi:tetratricopeptide (TPR) repeat protein